MAHGEREIPPPEECRVVPPSTAGALAVGIGLDQPPIAGGATADQPFVMPAGAAADVRTFAEISTAVRAALACENAGDVDRLAALYSEAYLERSAGPRGVPARATPPGALKSSGDAGLRAVQVVRLLADGRAGAIVHLDRLSDPRFEESFYVSFVRAGERWVIDEVLAAPANQRFPAARAELVDRSGAAIGRASFVQEFGGLVIVTVTVDGAPPRGHALHLHQFGSCEDGADGSSFGAAGSHFNPTGATHPGHAGDLGNLGVDTAGHGEYWTISQRFTLSPGPASVFDGDGSALILHEAMDDEATDPDGLSGPAIGCGVVTAVADNATEEVAGDGRWLPSPAVASVGLIVIGLGAVVGQGWRRHRRRSRRRV